MIAAVTERLQRYISGHVMTCGDIMVVIQAVSLSTEDSFNVSPSARQNAAQTAMFT